MNDSARTAGPVSTRDGTQPDLRQLRAGADAFAQAVGERHGLRIAELGDVAEHHAAAELLCRVWQAETAAHVIGADLIRALAHSGNYVAGAYVASRLVGVTVGVFGAGHLHSHITGVESHEQRHGVGHALKLHQRAWALARGIGEIRWTFDPLVRRNAHFNLVKLGARATAYLPDFYGAMSDGVNAGDASDRLYVTWDLASARVVAGPLPAPVRTATSAVLVDRVEERPVPAIGRRDAGDTVAVAVPLDIEALRQHDPSMAAQWRHRVREAVMGALGSGYRITGFSRDGCYLLSRR